MAKIVEKIEELVNKPITDLGYRVYYVMYVKEGKENYLRIFIDNDKGISLNDCEKVNDAITDLLDEADLIKDQYFLEISSPGLERNIRKDKHFEESIGKEVNIKLFKPMDNKEKEITGVLRSFDKETVKIETDKNEEVTIPRSNISSIKWAFKW